MRQHINVIASLDDVEPVVFGGTYGDHWSLGLGDLELRFPTGPEARALIAAAMIECLQEIQAEALRQAAGVAS